MPPAPSRPNLVLIASSTGGPAALRQLFGGLPRINAAVLLVQHMPPFMNATLCQALGRLTPMRFRLAEDGQPLEPGTVHVAPSGLHLKLENNNRIRLMAGAMVNFVCPAADVAFRSVLRDPARKLAGVILTGMGKDGAASMRYIKSLGGVTFAQDEASSAIYGMPKAAVETGAIDKQGSPEAIRDELTAIMSLLPTKQTALG